MTSTKDNKLKTRFYCTICHRYYFLNNNDIEIYLDPPTMLAYRLREDKEMSADIHCSNCMEKMGR